MRLSLRTAIPTAGKASVIALAAYGGLHFADLIWRFGDARSQISVSQISGLSPLSAEQQPIVSALTRLLDEEGVKESSRWAVAIVRASPVTDLGYIALVTAQIRRESHFLAPDLEWLYEALVPELAHELGLQRHTRTIGPMQVQRTTLSKFFRRTTGRTLSHDELEELSVDVESGVAAAVAVLDRAISEYVPDRRLRGWADSPGTSGLAHERVLARSWQGRVSEEERRVAARQKMLSDLLATPLALDGRSGGKTQELEGLFERALPSTTLPEQWRSVYDSGAPTAIEPRITHDKSVGFILADFNSGQGASRVAALQVLLNATLETDLATDGKFGPATREACMQLFRRYEENKTRAEEFVKLLQKRHKPTWVRNQALGLAHALYRIRNGNPGPEALIPDLEFYNAAQRIKGLGVMTVEGYISGSEAFFEDYLQRLRRFTGEKTREPTLRSQ